MKTILFFLTMGLSVSSASQSPGETMVLIPAGEFNMGKNSAAPTDWQPEHMVKVNSFYPFPYCLREG